MSGLFNLAYDPSSDVRKVVCTGLVQMLQLQQQRLQPHMHEIIEYMLQATQVRTVLVPIGKITKNPCKCLDCLKPTKKKVAQRRERS